GSLPGVPDASGDRLRGQSDVGNGDADPDRYQHGGQGNQRRKYPYAVAITPNGKTAYVVNTFLDTVTPIRTATGMAGKPIKVGQNPEVIAITPNGRTAYVVSPGPGTVTPIFTATNTADKPIKVGSFPWDKPIKGGLTPRAIAITPNGRTAYVVSEFPGTVTPIFTATNTADKPIKIPYSSSYVPSSTPGQRLIVSTPDGRTVYAVSDTTGTVTPIFTATSTAGKPIKVGKDPYNLAITPNGRVAEVVNQASE